MSSWVLVAGSWRCARRSQLRSSKLDQLTTSYQLLATTNGVRA